MGKGGSNPIKKFVRGVKKLFSTITSFVGDIVGFVIKPFSTPSLNIDAEQIATGVKINKTGTNIGIPIVYGYRRVGGHPIFVETDGSDNKYLYVVYAICEGEIQGITGIKIDENEIYPTVASGDSVYVANNRYNTTQGRYKDRLTFEVFYGTENQSQSGLANESKTWPTLERKLPGVAYAAFRFEWKASTQEEADSNPYGGGIPQVTFDVLGKKVYDLTTHSGGLDLANDYADLTKTYSTNPANCVADYLMNPRYGAGYNKSFINADVFKIAADKFDQTVTYDTSSVDTGKILTLNGVLSTNSKIIDNVRQLLSGCRSILPFIEGRYKLKVEDGGNATDITSSTIAVAYDITADNIVGTIALGGETKTTKFNNVFVNYIDPDLEYSSQQVAFSEAGDLAVDDNEDLTGEFTFDTITNPYMARDFARMIYKKSRSQRTISMTCTQELMDVEPGDIVRVTDTVLNLTTATFRVTNMKLNNDGTVGIEAAEHVAANYPYQTGPQVEIPPPLFLPDEYQGKPIQKVIGKIGVNPPPGSPPPRPKDPPTPPGLKSWVAGSLPNTSYAATYPDHLDGPLGENTQYSTFGYDGAFRLIGGNFSASQFNYFNAIGGSIALGMRFQRPSESSIDFLQFRLYKGTTLVEQARIPFRNIQTNGLPTTDANYVAYSPAITPEFPLNKGYEYSVTYYKSTIDRTYEIGGVINWISGFTSHTYDVNGETKTGSSLEAYINYLKDTIANLPDDGGSI